MRHEPSMSVRERMSTSVMTVRAETPLAGAVALMRERKIRHLPVVDRANRLIGMVTSRDLRQALFAPAVQVETTDLPGLLGSLLVNDVMIRGVVSVRADASIRDAARLMHERRLGALPVVEGGRVVGILTETDVLRALQEMLGDIGAAAISA